MPGKDDPLNQRATLWLDRDANEIARERYWHAWHALNPTGIGNLDDRHTWDVAWAAAVAVHSFITEGRLGPPVDDDGD